MTALDYILEHTAEPGRSERTDLAATHPHLISRWSKKNLLTPEDVTAGSHKKVLWTCSKGHEWEAMVMQLANNNRCPYCSGKRAIPGETDLATLRPDVLAQWDYEKNSADPREILPSSHDKAWWKCSRGHSWQAVIFSRTRENGARCPYCTGRLVLAGFNDLATLKPEIAAQWYAPLNGELRPEHVSPGSNRKVWWRCREGHVWCAAVYSYTRRKGAGCPVCAGVVRRKKPDLSLSQKEADSNGE